MLFATKTKSFFLERNDHAWLFARTSASTAPLTVEELAEVFVADGENVAEVLPRLQPTKSPSGYLHANCGVYTPRRLVRRTSLDLKRAKEANYLNEVCTQQFRIEPEKYTLAVLDYQKGLECDIGKPLPKEVLFCGMPSDEIAAAQTTLLEKGIYPNRLEMGSIATIGALCDYCAFKNLKSPTLLLEVGRDSTLLFIVSAGGVELARSVAFGIESTIPILHKKLGLRDEEAARKLFYSNTFDLAGLGAELVSRLIKELQSSIGFFEVQTGQTVGQMFCATLTSRLSWVSGTLSTQLGIPALSLDLVPWLQSHKISLSEKLLPAATDPGWLGLYALMIGLSPKDLPNVQPPADK